MQGQKREQWASKFGFILAAAGSAVGLGNIWKFPYVTGQNGGAAFVVIYLIAVLIVGFAVMVGEFAMGRLTQKNIVGTYTQLQGRNWGWIGWLGVFCGIVILSYYSVIGGWTIRYLVSALGGVSHFASEGGAGQFFSKFTQNGKEVLLYQGLFMLLTMVVVFRGVASGLERWCKALMPALIVLLIVLVIRSVTLPGAAAGVSFYLKPDFSKVTGTTVMAALSQAFFSLSLGLGTMLTYGSYLRKDVDLPKSALQICALDTFVAVMAGLVVFPAAFAFNVQPGAGPGLSFVTLPVLFAKVPLGQVWAFCFFVLLFLAALTSSISMLEIPVAYLLDRGWSRPKASTLMAIIIFVIGIPSAIGDSLGWSLFGKDIISAGSYLSDSILMPFGGLMICLVAGWFKRGSVLTEAGLGASKALTSFWFFLVRYVAPVAIIAVFLSGLKG